jgi:hypothetical protein
MSGFLSFISEQYGLKAEDVATDVFAYLLQRQDAQRALCQLFADVGYPYLKPGFSVKSRKCAEDGRDGGIPDITLSYGDGENKIIQAIIEDKFGAGLTKKQPCEYIKTVADNGIVLFVAPKWRQRSIWGEIRGKCQKSGASCIPIRSGSSGRIGKVGSKFIALIQWDKVLVALSNSFDPEVKLFVDQLKKLCDVEDTVKFENLSELVSDRGVGSTVFSSIELLERIVELAEADELFITRGKTRHWEGKNDDRSRGPCYFGYRGTLGANIRAWIGFDARLWALCGESPLWIEFDENFDQLKEMFFAARGRFVWLTDPAQLVDGESEDRQLVVPLPLKPGVELDALLASAIERIEQVKEVLNSPQKERP